MTPAANGRGMEPTMDTVNVLMTVGGIAVVLAVVALRKRNLAKGERRAAAAEAVDDYRRARDKADLGLVCPVCRGVAEPMGDTHDRYGCVACGHQFTAERHEWKTG